jgi:DNA polymerase-3 subunit gamma/tau
VQPISKPVVTQPSTPAINPHQKTFDALVKKLYDRDYDLGACFERNISFENFEDNKLSWGSMAEGADKKTLITHWGLINMFVKDIFGFETKIINMPKKKADAPKVEKEERPQEEIPAHQDADSASMIEDIEMKSSCIAPEAGETEAAKEKDPSTLLEEPMIKEAIALFDPKKVRIKRNT